jgi:predicted nucleic acid-binding protein
MIVVADSGPLLNLILLDETDLLRRLYGDVRIPPAVLKELSAPGTPAVVMEWIASAPSWVRSYLYGHARCGRKRGHRARIGA